MRIDNIKGGINWSLPAWHKDMSERNQCVLMQNLRYKDDYVDSILGNRKYHGISLDTIAGHSAQPVTAIMPYYNDQTDQHILLTASGDGIFKRDPSTNEFSLIKSGLTQNSIFTSVIRHGVLYIASTKDGLKKYLGGNQIENVGGNDTAPGSFRVIIYMKEIDRLFGISDDAIYGQITWCDLSDPEVWDGANVERMKLASGERTEGGATLYGKLIIFNTYSIWIYYVSGNEENWKLEQAPTTIGCVAPNTIKKIGNEIWYLGESPNNRLGIYAFNGSTSTLLTDDVTSLFATANKNKLRNACAEVHDDIYTISFASGFSEVNNISIDLDIVNRKADGTPAIYGPHTFAFYSSAVLNNRHNNKEFLMGDESDGFVYYESGQTLKSVNGTDGQLLQSRFISRIHNDDSFETVKRYKNISVGFRPRGFFDAVIKCYFSTGSYGNSITFNPNAQSVAFGGDFSVYEKPFYGTPELYNFWTPLGANDRGTSIQIEILNDVLAQRISFDEYGYEKQDLHKIKRVQSYAA